MAVSSARPDAAPACNSTRRHVSALGFLMKGFITLTGLYLVTAPFGFALNSLGVPLAWMIGPMLIVAVLCGSGMVKQTVPIGTRPLGQIVVATYIGTRFSPEILQSLGAMAPILIGISLSTLVVSLFIARLLMSFFAIDRVTAILSSVPTSPVEAGVMAEAHGVSPAPVIFSQTVRIALIVLIIPFFLFAANGFDAASVPAPPAVADGSEGVGLVIMLVGAVIGAGVFRVFRLPNPYFLGPLLTSSGLAAMGLQTYVMPWLVLAGAQVILGTWLGSTFRKELLMAGGHLIGAVLFSSLALLALCGGGAALLAQFVVVPFETLLLGAAPGGVTEMALTASILHQDVALVTAIHLARILVLMPNLGWIAKLRLGTTT